MSEKIFVSGLFSKDVPDSAPDFILGKLSVQPNQLIAWLNNNRKLEDEKGYISMTIKRSQNTGKRYIEVDIWKNETQEVKPEVVLPKVDVNLGEVDPKSVPFDKPPF